MINPSGKIDLKGYKEFIARIMDCTINHFNFK